MGFFDQPKKELQVRLEKVGFTYPNKTGPSLSGVSINMPATGLVGLVGESGSGKLTAIDVLIG